MLFRTSVRIFNGVEGIKMQNAILNNQITSVKSLKNLLSGIKAIMPIDKKDQLDAETIIDRLNLALSFDKTVKLQINAELNSDRVVNYTGKMLQTSNGNLLIQSSHKDLSRIIPSEIRFLELI